MSYKSDIVFLFSGGPANADPVKSLGGGVSSYEISPIINNLFKDGSEEEQNKGLTDYKCIYVYNSSQTNSFDSVRVFVDNVLEALITLFHDNARKMCIIFDSINNLANHWVIL
jgi:hypothetical protein